MTSLTNGFIVPCNSGCIAVCGWQLNAKLYLQLIDIEYQQSVMDEPSLLTVFDRAVNSDLDLDQRVAFSQRKLEFLEDFGSDINR